MAKFDPFTTPVSFTAGIKRGFIVRPTNDGGTGVGEPYTDSEGNELAGGGTSGGPNDKRFIGVKNAAWKARKRSVSLQEVGNIDWKGKWTTDKEEKREVLTFNGPQQRYWNFGDFEYGSEDKHNYIYRNGVICGIAPGPVLGAATVRDNDSVNWLLVIFLDGTDEVAYVRNDFYTLNSTSFEDGVVERLQKTNDALRKEEGQDVEDGWREAARFNNPQNFGGYTCVLPEAPWFFNVLGTQAKSMKRVEITHEFMKFENLGPAYDDMSFCEFEFTFDVATLSGAFVKLDQDSALNNYQKWSAGEIVDKTRVTYTQPAGESEDGFSHDFQEDYMQYDQYSLGETKVAVDFKPSTTGDTGEWVWGWIRGQAYQANGNEFTLGIDTPEPDGEPDKVSNFGSVLGPLPKPDPYVLAFGDHYEKYAIGLRTWLNLTISKSPVAAVADYLDLCLCWRFSGSASVAAGGTPDPNDVALAFIDAYDAYVQYADLREGLVVGYIVADTYSIDETGWSWTEESMQWAGLGKDTNLGADNYPDDWATYATDGDHQYHYRHTSGVGQGTVDGYSRTDAQNDSNGWEENFDWSYTNIYAYSPVLPYSNDGGAWHAPDFTDWNPVWFPLRQIPNLTPITWIQFLRDPVRCALPEGGVIGSTEKDEHLVSLIYFDPNEQDVQASAISFGVTGDALAELSPETRTPEGGLI